MKTARAAVRVPPTGQNNSPNFEQNLVDAILKDKKTLVLY